MAPDVRLAQGAEDNGLANMLASLLRQNLETKPHKWKDFVSLGGRVSIVADDADVSLTMKFERGGKLTIADGIDGIPDVTIRGPAEAIIALSNLPLATRFHLPIPKRGDREAMTALRVVASAIRRGKLHTYGMILHLPLLLKLTRVMSVNG